LQLVDANFAAPRASLAAELDGAFTTHDQTARLAIRWKQLWNSYGSASVGCRVSVDAREGPTASLASHFKADGKFAEQK
jgi:hypothetical protein